MTYKLPYQPTAETLARIKAMLSLIAGVNRPMMADEITKSFVELADVTSSNAVRMKTLCFRAGFLKRRQVPFTASGYSYSMADKGLKFLDLAEKRNALVAWREVMSDG